MATDHAVIVRFKYGLTDLSDLHALEDELIAAIESAGVGEFDGNEVAPDGSEATFYMYGPDADRLFEAIEPVLESSTFMHGAVATKRYGPPEDDVEEVHVTIESKSRDRSRTAAPVKRKGSGMRKRKPGRTIGYGEGDLFAVPLPQGGFGLCLVARKSGGGVTLGYFFGPRTAQPSALAKLPKLDARNACMVGWFGHLGITGGAWTLIGRLPGWRREDWPIPVFGRTDALEEEGWKVFYDDDGRLLREEPISVRAAKSLPEGGLMGSESAEIHLGKLLSAS